MSIEILRMYSHGDLSKISPGALVEDSKGREYVTFTRSSAAIGLLSTESLIECEIPGSIAWPIKLLPEGCKLILTQKNNKTITNIRTR